MSVFGVPTGTFVLIFGWIPFWWFVAAVSVYRMRQNDKRNDQADEVTNG